VTLSEICASVVMYFIKLILKHPPPLGLGASKYEQNINYTFIHSFADFCSN
jgi:hypothetical protein